MSVYYRLTDIDTVVKQDGDRTFVFDGTVNEWVRDRNNLLGDRFAEQDGEDAGSCVPISENEARAWLARQADSAE